MGLVSVPSGPLGGWMACPILFPLCDSLMQFSFVAHASYGVMRRLPGAKGLVMPRVVLGSFGPYHCFPDLVSLINVVFRFGLRN